MLIKPLVFRADIGVDETLRDLINGDLDPVLVRRHAVNFRLHAVFIIGIEYSGFRHGNVVQIDGFIGLHEIHHIDGNGGDNDAAGDDSHQKKRDEDPGQMSEDLPGHNQRFGAGAFSFRAFVCCQGFSLLCKPERSGRHGIYP